MQSQLWVFIETSNKEDQTLSTQAQKWWLFNTSYCLRCQVTRSALLALTIVFCSECICFLVAWCWTLCSDFIYFSCCYVSCYKPKTYFLKYVQQLNKAAQSNTFAGDFKSKKINMQCINYTILRKKEHTIINSCIKVLPDMWSALFIASILLFIFDEYFIGNKRTHCNEKQTKTQKSEQYSQLRKNDIKQVEQHRPEQLAI